MPKDSKPDIYDRVTVDMIATLEKGVQPWRQTWKDSDSKGFIPFDLPLRANGLPYSGINILLLWVSKEAAGYASNRWITYKQAQELQGHIRKGEKGTTIVYADTFTKTEEIEGGDKKQKQIWFLKTYTVFNIAQTEGLPESYYAKLAATIEDEPQRLERLEAFYNTIPAKVLHGGNKAFYNSRMDVIALPDFSAFHKPEAYYSARGHESIHWTGVKPRLDRDGFGKRYGSKEYAFEELVAELGASFLCAELGIYNATREDHACYLGEWLSILKEDKRAIFRAATEAQRAVTYLKSFSPEERTTE